MNRLVPLLSAVAVVGATAVGHAATIDFTDQAIASQANGLGTKSYNVGGGYTVTVTAGGVAGATISDATSSDANKDYGIGVKSSADVAAGTGDPSNLALQVNGAETLTVAFDPSVTIKAITLTNMYTGVSGTFELIPGLGGELAQWNLVDSYGNVVKSGIQFGNAETSTVGTNKVDVGKLASAANFSAYSGNPKDGYSLASISYGTPELSTKGLASAAVVLGGFGILFAGRRRRLLGPAT